MIMKKFLLSILISSVISPVFAQFDDDFDAFSKRSGQDFENFKAKTNAEFADFLKNNWERFQALAGTPQPKRPEPVKPIICKPDEKPIEQKISISSVIEVPTLPKPKMPEAVPSVEPEKESGEKFIFTFYGTECQIQFDPEKRFSLNDISEKNVGLAWEKLSDDDHLVDDCLVLKKELGLNDWGYVLLIKQLGQSFFKEKQNNENVFLQMYVLAQSGYKAKVARIGSRLVLLLAIDCAIYGNNYVEIDSDKFYMIDAPKTNEPIYTYRRDFYKEARPLSMWITEEPLLKKQIDRIGLFRSEKYPKMQLKAGVNENLIHFYKDYPQCDWLIYAKTPMSEDLKQMILPPLRQMREGKNTVEAANILINFVQTGFKYKTDECQFGCEKPFFADELFYYPYSDCEDRAVLFASLVKEILGLEVVLLHYPNHLATAVCFNEELPGDYILLNNQKYLICDPTYINAPIGRAMPEFREVKTEVIRIY